MHKYVLQHSFEFNPYAQAKKRSRTDHVNDLALALVSQIAIRQEYAWEEYICAQLRDALSKQHDQQCRSNIGAVSWAIENQNQVLKVGKRFDC